MSPVPRSTSVIVYRSVPLTRPPISYTTSSPKRGGGVFSSTQLVPIIRPLKKFCYVYDTATVHVHSYKSTNYRQYCSWSSCVVSLHRREELHFNSRARTFTTTLLARCSHPQEQQYCRSCTLGHSWYFLRKSGSEMTCTAGVNGDSERRSAKFAHV